MTEHIGPLLMFVPVYALKEILYWYRNPTFYIRCKNQIEAQQLIQIDVLQSLLENMHKKLNERVSKARKIQIEHQNKHLNILSHRFSVAEVVLVRITHWRDYKRSFR